jgi:hypothetical protein
MPHSSCFHHRARIASGDKYAEVRQVMVDIFERNDRCHGYRRIHASLSDCAVYISPLIDCFDGVMVSPHFPRTRTAATGARTSGRHLPHRPLP